MNRSRALSNTSTWCQYRDYFTSNKGIKCGKTVERMASQFHIPAPESFSFKHPEEWPEWIRFERYRLASGLDKKFSKLQVNALIYNMGDQADDILYKPSATGRYPLHGSSISIIPYINSRL